MEIESKESTTQTVEPTAKTETTEPVKNPEAVLAKNRELLAAQAKIKSELEELREFKKNEELSKQQKQGDFEGVINSLRTELAEVKGQRKKDLESQAFQTFESRIMDAAKDEGCVNPKKLMRLMTKEQMESVQLLQENGKFDVHGDDVKRLMDTLKEEHKDIGLFKNNQPNIQTIGGNFRAGSTVKTIDQMSAKEIADRLRTLT